MLIKFDGKKISELAKEHGLNRYAVYQRRRAGFTSKEDLFRPTMQTLAREREKLRAEGHIKYEGLPCKRCDSVIRYTRDNRCFECAMDFAEKNKEQAAINQRARYERLKQARC